MELYSTQILETVAVLLASAVARRIIVAAIKAAQRKYSYGNPRTTVIVKILDFLLFFIIVGGFLSIWGVERSELIFFLSSMLTILGIAFFAQWSILSNITSTTIIFFAHPAGIGDKVKILDVEFAVEGTIIDIGLFFIILQGEDGSVLSIPNNLFMQKAVVREDRSRPSSKTKEA
ncbi:Small-conductance mechanosensitive channel [Synechococcus sp. WH 5701]|uniref:mechanosensitive ion channel domain-containing protein n=1 Tax=Synechococcus sp. WH 5701 TaxID=69042 RepID=UPI0000698EDD|nr:Small-conductance mechanosensitive channel [Synechococcus sp. WH 5701]